MAEQSFDEWALVELFGHQRLAGRVSEQTIGGCSFVRVDVPKTSKHPEHTRFFGNGAIYSINPVKEPVARALAENIQNVPVAAYEVEEFMQPQLTFGPGRSFVDDHDPDEEQ